MKDMLLEIGHAPHNAEVGLDLFAWSGGHHH